MRRAPLSAFHPRRRRLATPRDGVPPVGAGEADVIPVLSVIGRSSGRAARRWACKHRRGFAGDKGVVCGASGLPVLPVIAVLRPVVGCRVFFGDVSVPVDALSRSAALVAAGCAIPASTASGTDMRWPAVRAPARLQGYTTKKGEKIEGKKRKFLETIELQVTLKNYGASPPQQHDHDHDHTTAAAADARCAGCAAAPQTRPRTSVSTAPSTCRCRRARTCTCACWVMRSTTPRPRSWASTP